MSGIYDFTNSEGHRNACEQGATFSRVINYKDSNNRIVNLTGYTASMQVRTAYLASSAYLTLDTTNGGIVITGATGKITLYASASTTQAITSGQYVYDLELSNGSGAITRLLEGAFEISPEVTR